MKLEFAKIWLIALSLTTISCNKSELPNVLEKDLGRLDGALNNSEEYIRIKELRINTIENMLSSRGITKLQQYNIYGELYEEYAPYQFNRATEMLTMQEELANELGSTRLRDNVRLERAMLYEQAGLHLEADNLMRSMDTTTFTQEQLLKWYSIRQKFLIDYSEYINSSNIVVADLDKVSWYQNKILSKIPEGTSAYRNLYISMLIHEHRYDEAYMENCEFIGTLDPNSRDYAMATYWQGVICNAIGCSDEALHWWIESAICDVRNATKDNASLYSIAMQLTDRGDPERAFRYTQQSLDDAVYYNSMLRRVQIASTLSAIEKSYSYKNERQQERMRIMIILLTVSAAIFAVVAFVAVYFFMKARRVTREIYRKNEELEKYSKYKEETEEHLKEVNRKLIEANEAKEEYLGLFLSQSSGYLDKLRKMLTREQYESELKNFYKTFDSSFSELYPTFVDEFNALLKEDARIKPKENDKLTIELRIFALIKLGITQSSHIASLLRYSVNTIYNYRAQIKNSALNNREHFEDMVKKIGSKN